MSTVNLDECNETDRGIFLCGENNAQKVYVHNVYPPIQELQPRVLVVVVIFFLCFIVGICGNSSILTIIRGVISERKNVVRAGHAVSKRRESDDAILYIGALCIVDFLMSLSLPPAILDSIVGFWMFGTTICKLHHVFGSVGRVISTFLITAMSFDRFVAVCHPYKTHYRSRKFILLTIATLWAIAFVLLMPMLIYASSNEIFLYQHKVVDFLTGAVNVTRVRVYKCSDMMPSYVFYWFTSSTFVLGYVVPLILIIFFNWRLVRRLYKHTKIIKKSGSGIPLKRILTYTILIAVFCFVFWTPYWCSVLYAIYMTMMDERADPGPFLVFVIYCVHLLPYFGSASNWILYGLLNTQLQVRHDVHQLSNPPNQCNNTNMVGTEGYIMDENVSMPSLSHNNVAITRIKVRDNFLSSPLNNRSASFTVANEKLHNNSLLIKHKIDNSRCSLLNSLNNAIK